MPLRLRLTISGMLRSEVSTDGLTPRSPLTVAVPDRLLLATLNALMLLLLTSAPSLRTTRGGEGLPRLSRTPTLPFLS